MAATQLCLVFMLLLVVNGSNVDLSMKKMDSMFVPDPVQAPLEMKPASRIRLSVTDAVRLVWKIDSITARAVRENPRIAKELCECLITLAEKIEKLLNRLSPGFLFDLIRCIARLIRWTDCRIRDVLGSL